MNNLKINIDGLRPYLASENGGVMAKKTELEKEVEELKAIVMGYSDLFKKLYVDLHTRKPESTRESDFNQGQLAALYQFEKVYTGKNLLDQRDLNNKIAGCIFGARSTVDALLHDNAYKPPQSKIDEFINSVADALRRLQVKLWNYGKLSRKA